MHYLLSSLFPPSLLTSHFKIVSIITLLSLVTACGETEESLDEDKQAGTTEQPSGTTEQPIVMVSSNSDLSDAQPLAGASLQGVVNIFFKEGSDWSARGVNRVVFYCCQGGADVYTVFPSDATEPYSIDVDLSQYESGVSYELYADVFFNDQIGPDEFTVNFVPTNSGNDPVPGNNAPTINGTPNTSIDEDMTYSFTPIANDLDGDNLSFSIINRPSWASFSSSIGTLSGTPTNTNVGSTNNIVITVTDGFASASLPAFDLFVVNVNDAPTITGTPATSVVVDNLYSYIPIADDVDGDDLVFSINNRPSWAVFNVNTGQLSGTPVTTGIYLGITITVTDGFVYSSLPSFDVEATPTPTLGSATLYWTPPTQYTDNSPLTDLAGYNIYYGTTTGLYPNTISIDNPGLTEYLVENLIGGNTTYHFVMTSVNSVGVESAYSNPVSRTVQ